MKPICLIKNGILMHKVPNSVKIDYKEEIINTNRKALVMKSLLVEVKNMKHMGLDMNQLKTIWIMEIMILVLIIKIIIEGGITFLMFQKNRMHLCYLMKEKVIILEKE